MKVLDFPQDENREFQRRIYGLLAIISITLFALLARAWHLQVVEGAYYRELSDNNRVRMVQTPSPRGLIYDRHGALLVSNDPSFNLYVVMGDMLKPDRVLHRLADLIEMDREEMMRRVRLKREDPYLPIKVKTDLSMKEVARVEGNRLELPGVTIETEFKRNAIYGPLAVHLLGYVGEISKDHLGSGFYPTAQQGDIVGQYGVERSYDRFIRGTPGQKGIEVDALGHEIRTLKVIEPLRGKDIFLTLDLNLQKAAEEALGEKSGAIVVMDPRNGDLLAMVSRPAFNPNVLSKGIASEEWEVLLADKMRPLMNRAIQGQYPPGSTFKIVLSAALLETKTVSPSSHVECRGGFPFGNRVFRDWKKGGHGMVALHRAIVESCDVYFYEMGNRLGIDAISRFSHLLGLGRPTGVDLASEKGGLIPSTEWKRRTRNEPWFPGETLSVSIGQSYVSVTPLQMATMINAVANKGVWYPPNLLKRIRDDRSGTVEEIQKKEGKRLPISVETLQFIQNALAGVVSEPSGTAHRSRSEIVPIAGKTGTAQVVALPERGEKRNLSPDLNDHAWFVAYAPVGDPQLSVVVLVENGGHGGAAAAPLASRIIESYFRADPMNMTGNMAGPILSPSFSEERG